MQDTASPSAAPDAAASNMDVTTAGADSTAPAAFSGNGLNMPEPTSPTPTEAPAEAPEPAAAVPAEPAASVVVPTTDAPAADLPDDLLQIKQQALQQLSPLVGHLEQTPEEKFRTTMMMIQASDNQGLIKDAYAAAQAIEDEKVRAQALLDIINEINYFTQQHQQA